ncbi:MAG: ABC transporter permease [Candidatus Rokuibacteriota bacterium]
MWFRLRAVLRRLVDGGAGDQELTDEIRAFVEQDTESKIRSGMIPDDARRAALLELGGAEQVKEHVRDARAGARLEGVVRDIRYAVRSLVHARAFSFSVIGNLSLGLAAMIGAFAFINGALLRQFPGVREQDRLVTLGILENTPIGPRLPLIALADYPVAFRALRERMTSLEGLASYTESRVAVALPQPRSLQAAFVSPNYFDVLGIQPAAGRTFASEEGHSESAAAIIGHALWTGAFGRDRSAIGRPIRVGRQVVQIVGVAPPGFAGTNQDPDEEGVDLWLPIALTERLSDPGSSGRNNIVFLDDQPGERLIRYVGRMRDGVRPDRVEAELGTVARPIAAFGDVPAERVMVEVSGLSRLDRTDGVNAVQLTATILSVPFVVLVIACVNAANLLLVRATRRRREMALRLALGASRLRLVRQLVIESLVLAISAAVLALPLAWSGLQAVAAFMTIPTPLDGTVVAGALAAAFLTALGFGLVPALRAASQQPSATLGTSPAGSGGTRGQSRGHRALVAGQIALSLGLLATGFQLTSALESLAEPPGTDPDRLLLASFDLAQIRFSSAEIDVFYAALLDRASRLPGVEAAGLSSRNLARSWTFDPANLVRVDAGNGPMARMSGSASGDYFNAVGLDLIRGREFVSADRRDIPDVAIVTERLASQLFGDAALGRSLRVSTPFRGATEADVRIVGIVTSPVERSGDEVPAIFFPSPFPSPIQHGTARTLHIRSDGPSAALGPAIRDLVARLDPQVPILALATLDDTIRADTLLERTLAKAAALLGIVALLLASIGLYGVTSYSVAMRGREIAVRMAMGARASLVVVMVVRQALAVAAIGSAVGGLVAIAAGLLIQTQVFGVAGVDVATLGGSAVLLAAAMLLASLLPAWRAARLDPNVVLREA